MRRGRHGGTAPTPATASKRVYRRRAPAPRSTRLGIIHAGMQAGEFAAFFVLLLALGIAYGLINTVLGY